MSHKNQIPYWGCLIISNVFTAADKLGWALVWIVFAGVIAFLDYTANKDTNKPA
jgi:hypothetical protein